MVSMRMIWKSSSVGLKIESIIVDPAAASFIAELKKRGFKVKKAKNDVLDGIRFVGNLLNLGVLLFLKDCKETIKEFGSYIWDEKAIERGEDKPVKQFDHWHGCCTIFCLYHHKTGTKMELR